MDGTPLLRRAAIAGISEPRLVNDPNVAHRAILLIERVTWTLLAEDDRGSPGVRALRGALGCCWSVAVAADPRHGVPAFTRIDAIDDPDTRWIVRENRRNKRMQVAVAANP